MRRRGTFLRHLATACRVLSAVIVAWERAVLRQTCGTARSMAHFGQRQIGQLANWPWPP